MSIQTTVEGENFIARTTYDNAGRISNLTYPITGFGINNIYNPYGFLVELRDASTNALYWRMDAVNALGQNTHETFGNNLATIRAYDPATGLLQTISTGSSTNNISVQNLTYQFDGGAYERTTTGTLVEHKHYVMAGGNPIASGAYMAYYGHQKNDQWLTDHPSNIGWVGAVLTAVVT